MTDGGVPTYSDLGWRDVAPYFPQQFPPLDLRIQHVTPTFSASATFGDLHTNPLGMVHGGVVVTVLDVFMALLAAADASGPQVTQSIEVRFQRPWRIGRPVEFEAHIAARVNQTRSVEIIASQRAVVARAVGEFVQIAVRSAGE